MARRSGMRLRRLVIVWLSAFVALATMLGAPPATAATLPFQLYLPVPANAVVKAGGTHPMDGGSSGARSSVDIGAGGGGQMDVVAAAGGTVTVMSSLGWSRCRVRIQHTDGWETDYYHLKGIPASIVTGVTVSAGQKIGEMGHPGQDTCGSGTFRHLHFSIMRNGAFVDISGTSIGGYTVHGTGSSYCGYWTRNSDGAMVADARTSCLAVPGFTNNQLLPGSTPPSPAADSAQNLLRSASFEDGMNGWGGGSGAINFAAYSSGHNNVTAHEGSKFGAWNTSVSNRSLAQTKTIAVSAGDSYTGSVWVRSSNGTYKGKLVLWGLGNGDEQGGTDFTVGTDWTLVSAPLNATRSHSSIKLEIYGSTTGKDLYVDAATLAASNQTQRHALISAGTPSVSGKAAVGATLTAEAGTWQPSPMSVGYQWLHDGVAVSKATKQTYVLDATDLGKKIAVTVTSMKTGYGSVSKTSATTATVLAGALTPATPTISGTARAGENLTAKPGTWAPPEVKFAYRWYRSGATVSGATKATYNLTNADVGKSITVNVTGSRAGYTSVSRTSAATVAVAPASALKKLTATPTPKISGTAKVGRKLTAKPGAWKPSGVKLTYQWYRNGSKIDGATASSYSLAAADKGKKITVKVTGSKTGYATVTKTSKATKKVAAGTLTTAKPKISGTAKVGKTLTAKVGKWKPSAVTLSYQWYRSGKKISKATEATYTLTKKDKAKKIKVKVTGKAPGYTTKTTTSKTTKKIR